MSTSAEANINRVSVHYSAMCTIVAELNAVNAANVSLKRQSATFSLILPQPEHHGDLQKLISSNQQYIYLAHAQCWFALDSR